MPQMPQDDPMDHHRAGDPPLKVTREIPLPWLISIVAGLAFQGVTVWLGQQSQGQAIRDMSTELRELRTEARAGGLKTVEHELKLSDHERRITALEQAK